MKATKLLIAAAAFAGLAAFSFAGPGPEYWARTNPKAQTVNPTRAAKPATESKATRATTPAKEIAASCAACECCQAKKS